MLELEYSVHKGARNFVTGVRSICMGVLSFMAGAFSFVWAGKYSSVSYGRVRIGETDWFGSALCAQDNCSRSSSDSENLHEIQSI